MMLSPSSASLPLAQHLMALLAAACAVGNARHGLMYVYHTPMHQLELVATYGLAASFAQLFRVLPVAAHSLACTRAVVLGKRVIIPNITEDPFYLPYLALARQLGYQAIQATPIIHALGEVLGAFTTSFAQVYHPRRADTTAWDHYAAQAAGPLRRWQRAD